MHAPSIAAASARHRMASLSFRTGEIEDLVREGRRYDVVICSEVLEHIADPAPFLVRLHELTEPDGALIITTPNGYGAYEWLSSLQRMFQRVGIHQALRWTVWKGRRLLARARGTAVPTRPLEYLTSDEAPGFINIESGHVQFFGAARLEGLFTGAGFRVVSRRGRTLLCGPYVDVLFALFPSPARLYDLNNRAADVLPFRAAADWMFLLSPR
jgi:SAM-dependent methyltransferase